VTSDARFPDATPCAARKGRARGRARQQPISSVGVRVHAEGTVKLMGEKCAVEFELDPERGGGPIWNVAAVSCTGRSGSRGARDATRHGAGMANSPTPSVGASGPK
jgi:hypothetical protein